MPTHDSGQSRPQKQHDDVDEVEAEARPTLPSATKSSPKTSMRFSTKSTMFSKQMPRTSSALSSKREASENRTGILFNGYEVLSRLP